jgi:hypothetical protein
LRATWVENACGAVQGFEAVAIDASAIALQLLLEAAGRRELVEDLADAFGEDKASKRARHVRNVRPPPRSRFGGLALEHGDGISDANRIAGLTTGASAQNGEPASEQIFRSTQHADDSARPSVSRLLREGKDEPDPLLAHPRRRFAGRDRDDTDLIRSKLHLRI